MRCLLTFLLLLCGLLSACGDATAPEVPHVALLQYVPHPALDAIRDGILAQFAADSFAMVLTEHNARGEAATAAAIAGQLATTRPDLVIAIATPAAQACARALTDIPVIFAAVSDPVAAGLVRSLEEPGGNLTGTSDRTPVERQVALIRQYQPSLTRLAVISTPAEIGARAVTGRLRAVCAAQGLTLVERSVNDSATVATAVHSLRGEADALYMTLDNTVAAAWPALLRSCQDLRLPLYPADGTYVPLGGVATVATDNHALGAATARLAMAVLRGADPATLPVVTGDGTAILRNDTAALAFGLTPPPA